MMKFILATFYIIIAIILRLTARYNVKVSVYKKANRLMLGVTITSVTEYESTTAN